MCYFRIKSWMFLFTELKSLKAFFLLESTFGAFATISYRKLRASFAESIFRM
jgi:hypothetical protein